MPRFARTIRFDDSDDRVFPRGAGPDEWAVSGAVVFAGSPPQALGGKPRQAFVNGFLSAESLGWSTFVSVAEIGADEIAALTTSLTKAFLDDFSAPDEAAAAKAASREVSEMLALCNEAAINTLFAVSREFDASGEIRETVRRVSAPGKKPHTRIWDVVEE